MDDCSASAVLRDEFDGGGDRTRGDVGQAGEAGPDLLAPSDFAASSTPSTPGNNWALGADSARCIAAADGTVEAVLPGPLTLVGLKSWLFFRDRLG